MMFDTGTVNSDYDNITNNIINKKIFNVTKFNTLIQHSFNSAYNSNILNKKKPKVIHHIFTSHFIFDLSCGNTFTLKKNIIKAAFQNTFCRGLTPLPVKASALVKKVKVQTVQFVLHCSKNPVKPLKNPLIEEATSKTPFSTTKTLVPWFLNFKTKKIVPRFFGKRASSDCFTLDLKLNNLFVFYKGKKEPAQNKRNLFLGILNNPKEMLAFSPFLKKHFGGRPLVFIKAITRVFNKAVQKSRMPWPIPSAASDNKSLETVGRDNKLSIATFKNPRGPFLGSKEALLCTPAFDMKKASSQKKLAAGDTKSIKNPEQLLARARWLTAPRGCSPLADQKRRCSQYSATGLDLFIKGGELFGESLVRADWVLGRFVEQLGTKKMNPRGAMNQQINDIRVLIDKMGSECPIKGMRITITGRLGSRKKAMAQQISKFVGKVPLSTFRQKVDYRQGVLPTRFGLVGVKIWVCYSSNVS